MLDSDQEENEVRSGVAVSFVILSVVRLGLHHRLSNMCNKEIALTTLKAALREFCGGFWAKASLHGAFEYWRGIAEEEARTNDTRSQDIERETKGKSVAEGLAEGPTLSHQMLTL